MVAPATPAAESVLATSIPVSKASVDPDSPPRPGSLAVAWGAARPRGGEGEEASTSIAQAKLASSDVDNALDVYDASVNGKTYETAKPVECSGDACQQPASPPVDATPGSLTFNGAGNVVACPKGKVKKNGHCVKRKAKHKKHSKGKKHKHARGRGGR